MKINKNTDYDEKFIYKKLMETPLNLKKHPSFVALGIDPKSVKYFNWYLLYWYNKCIVFCIFISKKNFQPTQVCCTYSA